MQSDFPSIEHQFEHLFKVISSSRFLQKQGLGNEVPFFITAFPPAKQNQVDRLTRSLISKLENHGVYVLEINLYDLSVELMRNRKTGETNVWDRMLEKERTLSNGYPALSCGTIFTAWTSATAPWHWRRLRCA